MSTPGLKMEDPGEVEGYNPVPPEAPKSSAQQFKSGLAGGQELSMADQAATDKAHQFITHGNQKIRSHKFAADASLQKYLDQEHKGKVEYMNTDQNTLAQMENPDQPVAPPPAPPAAPPADAAPPAGGESDPAMESEDDRSSRESRENSTPPSSHTD